MELQNHDEQESVPKPSDVSSLEDVRTTLAGDVVEFLALSATANGYPDAVSRDETSASSGQRQVLLRAAVADLDAMDERLHHARE
jgi:hypothetical protein